MSERLPGEAVTLRMIVAMLLILAAQERAVAVIRDALRIRATHAEQFRTSQAATLAPQAS